MQRAAIFGGGLATLCAGVGAAALLDASPAEACGGVFCDTTAPVVQVDEEIIFTENEDDSVTAVIRIFYQGEADSFAWVLPVPGVPEVGVSSNVAFNRLRAATDPNYVLQREVIGECSPAPSTSVFAFGCSADAAYQVAGDGDVVGNEGVIVEGGGSVGPYDYEVISVDDAPGDDPAELALTWLDDNGYEATDLGADLIRPYLESGLNLIAFRLTKDAQVGDIRPVTMTYEGSVASGMGQLDEGRPAIPIKLTAVAAQDDMGVMVWTVSENRGTPVNYRSLELNEALINWFNWRFGYGDVIDAAADEAGGQGFVTEMADDSDRLDDVIWLPQEEETWQDFRSQDWDRAPVSVVEEAARLYASYEGLNEAVRQSVELEDGVTAQDVLRCPECGYVNDMDPAVFLDAVEENIIDPLRDTQALVMSRPKITRLYTTMSADDMTVDPVFDFNEDLPDVDRVRTAPQVVECNALVSENEAPWEVTLPSGEVVRGQGFNWPVLPGDMPANRRVLQVGRTGPGEVVVDNVAEIQDVLEAQNRGIVGGGCGALARQPGLYELAGMLGVMMLARRLLRRRRR